MSYTSANYNALTNKVNVIIPNTFTTIADNAFLSATSLISIYIPNTITSIGNSAFQYASSLTTVTFEAGSNLETIRTSAFRDVTTLNVIDIPSSVTSIGTDVFLNSGLEYIFAPSTLISEQGWTSGSNVNNVYGKEGVIVLINIDDINVTLVKNSLKNEIILMSENNYNQVSQ